jgi:hypothetical protein
VPVVGDGTGGGTLSFEHTVKLFWHEAAHPVWTILIFGMGVKLPATLIVAEDKRIIAAGTIWLRMTNAHIGNSMRQSHWVFRSERPVNNAVSAKVPAPKNPKSPAATDGTF